MITHFCTGLHCPEGCTDPSLMIPEWEESVLGQPVCPAGARDNNGYNTATQHCKKPAHTWRGLRWVGISICMEPPDCPSQYLLQQPWDPGKWNELDISIPITLEKRSLQRMMSKHLDKTQLNIWLKLEHLLELTMRERKMFHLLYAWIKITRK